MGVPGAGSGVNEAGGGGVQVSVVVGVWVDPPRWRAGSGVRVAVDCTAGTGVFCAAWIECALVGVNVLSGTAVSAIVKVTSTASWETSWEAGCDVLQAASNNPVATINSRKDLFTMIVFGLYPPGEIFRIKKY